MTRRRLPLAGREDEPKRLLPEVLPAPTQRAGPAAPRQRTAERMTHLLAVAASAAACGGSPPPETNAGYSVVDMVPVPARCAGISSGMHATAEWKKVMAGVPPNLVVKVGAPEAASGRLGEGQPTPNGAVLVSAEAKDGGLTIELMLRPETPATYNLTVRVPVTCATGPAAVTVYLGFNQIGGELKVSVSDDWGFGR
jgi:hypothetical protein